MLEENRPDYSVVFLFFAGEEAGLRGSNHYVENPSIPLKNIRFLLNLDMVSTGSDGIKVVNGPKFIPEFDRLVKLNDSLKLLKTVSPRGESKNSDHYPFYAKEVRCFFIYTLGNEWKEYHTPGDKAEGLPLTAYKEMFRLITAWAKELMN
jgi:Zn-dependent M28 family amino/carboxypeptidase